MKQKRKDIDVVDDNNDNNNNSEEEEEAVVDNATSSTTSSNNNVDNDDDNDNDNDNDILEDDDDDNNNNNNKDDDDDDTDDDDVTDEDDDDDHAAGNTATVTATKTKTTRRRSYDTTTTMTTTKTAGTTCGTVIGGGSSGVDILSLTKLSQLQNYCKRDPDLYRDDYNTQVRRLHSQLQILSIDPTSISCNTMQCNEIIELIQFVAAVSSSSYKGFESDTIANMIIQLLVGNNNNEQQQGFGNNMMMWNSNRHIQKGGKQQQHRRRSKGSSYGNNNDNATDIRSSSASSLGLLSSATGAATMTTTTTTTTTTIRQLNREIRKSAISALILMRNKGCLDPLRLLQLAFTIMSVIGNNSNSNGNNSSGSGGNNSGGDKALREMLYKHIIHDIRNINKKGKRDDVLNRSIQSFMHRIVATTTTSTTTSNNNNNNGSILISTTEETAVKRAVDIVCELYRRRVWIDERTVAILATAITSPIRSVMIRAIHFFLNIEMKMMDDDIRVQENHNECNNTRIDYHSHSKKTAARQRHTIRQLKNRKKLRFKQQYANGKRQDGDWLEDTNNNDNNNNNNELSNQNQKLYPAIELLRDPQSIAEHVFDHLRRHNHNGKTSSSSSWCCNYKYETKLLMLNFVTRLVGNHRLLLLSLYPYLQKHLKNGNSSRSKGRDHSSNSSSILAYVVQSCHDRVPPEDILGLISVIAHTYITERVSEEQIAVAINATRIIIQRVPAVLLLSSVSSETTTQTNRNNDNDNMNDDNNISLIKVDEEHNNHDDNEGEGDVVNRRRRRNNISMNNNININTMNYTNMDIRAFCYEIYGYCNHRDRSINIAARSFINVIRELHPILLSNKKQRGMKGTAIIKNNNNSNTTNTTTTTHTKTAKKKMMMKNRKKKKHNDDDDNNNKQHKQQYGGPLQYGEERISSGVEGADLLAEYEAKKKAHKLHLQQQQQQQPPEQELLHDVEEEEDEECFEEEDTGQKMGDEDEKEEEEEDVMPLGEYDGAEVDDSDSDSSAPQLVVLGEQDKEKGGVDEEEDDEEEEEEEEAHLDSAPGDDKTQKENDNADDENKDDADDEEEEEEEESSKSTTTTTTTTTTTKPTSSEVVVVPDIAKMTHEQRESLKRDMSTSRIFSTRDFIRMRKLVEREQRAKRDPREAARRKRVMAAAAAQAGGGDIDGGYFERLSDDDDDDSEDDDNNNNNNDNSDDSDDDDDNNRIKISGAVDPKDIMAQATKKRQNKADRLKKIVAGRSEYELKQRENRGGATNTEKKRTKNFQMSKRKGVSNNNNNRKNSITSMNRKRKNTISKYDAKKRRRKL